MPRMYPLQKLLAVAGVFLFSWICIIVHMELTEIKEMQSRTAEAILEISQRLEQRNVAPRAMDIPKLPVQPMPIRGHSGYITSKLYAITAGGGLGNQLFELVSLLGIASTSNRTAYLNANDMILMQILEQSILPRFPRLLELFQIKLIQHGTETSAYINAYACCKYDDVARIRMYKEEYVKIEGIYFQSFKYFWSIRNLLRDVLTPHWLATTRAAEMLMPEVKDDFKICTHVRRGDFVSDGMHLPSEANFTRMATEYLAKKYSKPGRSISVVILGNDPQWAQIVFADRLRRNRWPLVNSEFRVILTPTLSPEIDLAFSRQFCDVTLITAPSSTFGWWLSFMAKDNATSYYRDIEQTEDAVLRELEPLDFYPHTWTKLRTTESGAIYEQHLPNAIIPPNI